MSSIAVRAIDRRYPYRRAGNGASFVPRAAGYPPQMHSPTLEITEPAPPVGPDPVGPTIPDSPIDPPEPAPAGPDIPEPSPPEQPDVDPPLVPETDPKGPETG